MPRENLNRCRKEELVLAVAAAGGVEVWTHVERVEEMILFVGEQEVQLLLLEQDEKDCTLLQLSTEQGKVC